MIANLIDCWFTRGRRAIGALHHLGTPHPHASLALHLATVTTLRYDECTWVIDAVGPEKAEDIIRIAIERGISPDEVIRVVQATQDAVCEGAPE